MTVASITCRTLECDTYSPATVWYLEPIMKKLIALSSLVAPILLSAQSYLDPSFGVGGSVTLEDDGSFEEVREIAVQADGTIVAAGQAR